MTAVDHGGINNPYFQDQNKESARNCCHFNITSNRK